MEKEIIFYDERCPLCNHVIRWIMHSDTKDIFRFAPLTVAGEEFPELEDKMDLEQRSTVYLHTHEGDILSKSDVVIYVSGKLGGLWKAGRLLQILPKGFRDRLYEIVAKYRFKLTGKELSCELPPVDKRHKFIQFGR